MTARAARAAAIFVTWSDRRQAVPAKREDALDWPGVMALDRRETLDGAGREKRRNRVRERIELDDDEGWFHSEATTARYAFDRRRIGSGARGDRGGLAGVGSLTGRPW